MCVSSVDSNSKTWRCLRPPMAAVPCWSLVLPHILRKLSERAAMLIGRRLVRIDSPLGVTNVGATNGHASL